MSDSAENLEAELSRIRPREPSDELIARIEKKLSRPKQSAWPDRFLISAMSAGAAAACVIVGMFINGATSPAPLAPPAMDAKINPTLLAESQVALARTEPPWMDATK